MKYLLSILIPIFNRKYLFIALFSSISLCSFSQNGIMIDISEPLYAINPTPFIKNSFSGKGVNLGIIDVGFEKFSSIAGLKHVVNDNRLIYARNFLYRAMHSNDSLLNKLLSRVPKKDLPVFRYSEPGLSPLADTFSLFNMGDVHGSMVSCLIAGYPKEGNNYALGKDANFFLAKTEFGLRDHRIEEELLGRALEDFYSKGVRLVNISLGYKSNFLIEKERYTPGQLDGKTAVSSRYCNEYVRKGMIIIVAAGNEGVKPWKAVSAPGEAEEVITVGSTRDTNSILKAGFSSIGEGARIKPDICCYSFLGTSLSAPVITGLVSAMLQKDSTLSPKRVKEILQRSSTLYPYANNYVGYGVPDAEKIWKLMENQSLQETATKVIATGNIYELRAEGEKIECFHKSDTIHVISQEEIKQDKNAILIVKRPKNARFSTIVTDMKKVIEIEW